MKNPLTIIFLTCSCIAAQGQYVSSTTWNNFIARYKTDTSNSNKYTRSLQAENTLLKKKLDSSNIRFDTSFYNLRTFSAFEFKGIKGRLKYLEDSTVVVQFDSTVMIRNMLITAKTPALELLQKIEASLQQQADASEKLRKSIPIISYPLQ